MITAVALSGLWLALPWYLPWVMAALLVTAAVLGWKRVEGGLPDSRPAWIVLIALVGVSVILGAVSVQALLGRRSPPGEPVTLSFPLRGGPFLVTSGGSNTLVNPHVATLGPSFEAYRGQSYGVDLVGIGRWGSRNRGLVSAHPADYAIYGVGVASPCDGTVVRANKLESCYIRPLSWIGSQKLGVSPRGNQIHLMVAAWPWGAYLGEEGMKRGIRVKISSYTRHHVNITMTQAKAVSNYTNSILANMEALDDGYDEAMLLDSAGFVSEGAGENLFVVKDGVIYTPDLSAGALNGITRNTVFHICKDLGLEIVQKRITRDEVYIADEAFFTGTAAEVTPIRELDRIEIGAGSRGPLTEKIQSAFFDIVNGRNSKYAHWLTKV
jgi:branched-chain amino acid aminotransferase